MQQDEFLNLFLDEGDESNNTFKLRFVGIPDDYVMEFKKIEWLGWAPPGDLMIFGKRSTAALRSYIKVHSRTRPPQRNAYKKDKAQCRHIVIDTIIPALGHMSSHLIQAAKELAPIPSTEYAHQRESTQQKNNAKAAALKRNASIQTIMLEDYVKASENADSSPSGHSWHYLTPFIRFFVFQRHGHFTVIRRC